MTQDIAAPNDAHQNVADTGADCDNYDYEKAWEFEDWDEEELRRIYVDLYDYEQGLSDEGDPWNNVCDEGLDYDPECSGGNWTTLVAASVPYSLYNQTLGGRPDVFPASVMIKDARIALLQVMYTINVFDTDAPLQ
ncbi:hypothetical protein HDU86_003430 [Geranomyces michiganensis]|nr:hypothetical protein HDU86_003430 [Geranomyces michiganensis]